MQTHAIPYPFVGFVTCISRSRERDCPSYVLVERKTKLRVPIVQNRNIFIYHRLYERLVVRAATSFLFRNCLMLFN